jgi:HK97 family phage major capsid protein
MMRAQPRMLSGLKGNVALPRQATGGGGVDGRGESGLRLHAVEHDVRSGHVEPKTIAQTEGYTKQLFAQSIEAIGSLVQRDIFAGIGLKYDAAALHGDGTSNSITGLYSISGLNSVAFGAAVSYAKLVACLKEAAIDNALLESQAFVTTPGVAANGMTTARFSSTDTPLWVGPLSEGQLIGYKALASNQVSTTLGSGADNGLIFGSWSQAIAADWGAVDLTVDTYTLAHQGLVKITGLYLADFNVRHPEAFVKATTLTAS